MKYSFIVPYFQRIPQFRNTLRSWRDFYGDRTDWEVIVVEDSKSGDTEKLRLLLAEFSDPVGRPAGSHIRHIQVNNDNHYNPAISFNRGAAVAEGAYYVITNPECMHLENALESWDEEVATGYYLVCRCMAVKDAVFENRDMFNFTFERWYDHPDHRAKLLHWCAVLPAKVFHQIGGFDERFAEGIAWDDGDFRDRASQAMNGIKYSAVTVAHQKHHWSFDSLPKGEQQRRFHRNKALITAKRAGMA